MKNIGILAGIMILLVLALVGCKKVEPGIEVIEKEELPEQKAEESVSVGYGWSTKDNPKEAVAEAVSSVKESLGEKIPEYAILFTTVGYDTDTVLKEIKALLPTTQIYGGTSLLGVLTKDGYHVGETGSLSLLAISSPKIKFGVGGANMDDFASPRDAGKEAITSAIKNAGMEGELPKIVLITAAPGHEEEILQGIEDIISKNTPIVGGSSGDNDITGKWKQFANDKVYSNGISLTAIFTDLKVSFAYDAGYLITENQGIITNASGRVIYEIDHKPAAIVYNEWTGGIISDKLETGGTVLSETTFYPLAKLLKGESEELYYLSVHPLSVNLPEKSLTVFTDVQQGEEILLMRGNWELLLNRAQSTPHNALTIGNIGEGEGYFGIYTFCAGTLLAIPEEERAKIPLLINSELGGIPFVGTFTFGEQGFVSGIGNMHGNLVNSMIIFSE
jgi:hypothetical protein